MGNLICYCSGGLGNRIRPIPSCMQLAQKTNRDLLIYWEDSFRCRALFNDIFTNSLNFIDRKTLMSFQSYTIYCSRWDAQHVKEVFGDSSLDDLIQKFGTASIGANAMDIQDQKESIIIISNNFLTNTDMNMNKQFIRELKLRDDIQKKIDTLVQSLGLNQNIVGVHARGSDFNIHISEYEYYMQKIMVNNPNTKFFICSDDYEYEKALLNKYPQNIIVNSNKHYVQKNDPNNHTWLNNAKMTKEAIVDSVIDMHLLSKTNFQIFNEKSSFAQLVRIIQGN